MWKVFKAVSALAAIAVFVSVLPDLVRYLKMEAM